MELEYLIVLGAHINGTEPSRALQNRLNTAMEYLEKNPKTLVVVSGGKGSDEDISEAEAMGKYLICRGIAAERIILEDQSTNTVENLKFTAKLISKEAKIGIVTNDFHIYRSLKLAKKQGYTSVCGISAPSVPLYQPYYVLREILAMIKEWLFHNI